MEKLFNIAGPCNPQRHYTLSPAARLPELQRLVDDEQYFLIHAARQSGKTTCIQQFARQLNADGHYHALYCSLETLRDITTTGQGIARLLSRIDFTLQNSSLPRNDFFTQFLNRPDSDPGTVLQAALSLYCRQLDRPLVILFDEADGLPEPILIPFITQLRNGYIDRNSGVPFPHSVALVGLRNIRDYRRHIRPDSASLGGLSPFNIITEVMTLKNFTREEIAALYAQHTAETGQVFESEAIDHVYEQTLGQPWLVNAVAREVVEKSLDRDYSRPVTFDLVHEAIQRLIKNRPVHLDNLLERLKEEPVRNIIQPLLLGDEIKNRQDDDFQYAKDLGLIHEADNGEVFPGNPIYAEMIVRALSAPTQQGMANPDSPWHMPKYVLADGGIDMDSLLADFVVFWHEHSPAWKEDNGDYGLYSEASLVILLCAFLNRLVNGGGENESSSFPSFLHAGCVCATKKPSYIVREMAAGRGRMDVGVVYKGRKYPIEVKIRRERNSLETVEAKGREQLRRYMERMSADKGWLLIHDRPAGTLTIHPEPVTGDLLRGARGYV
jgi:AAA+ ATPase superfamily predicted ATPase